MNDYQDSEAGKAGIWAKELGGLGGKEGKVVSLVLEILS